ncbi:hypothetical protein GGI20_005459 [Coemansia sp. BCRC 34301]|nr:hypothetical protein GGI20_005459 [Coemansia sp. BCRC 34301]
MASEKAHRGVLIADYITESLRALPAGSFLAVRVVYTADHPSDSLTPRRRLSHFHAENTLLRRALVLVLQGGCLVAGLEVHEFTTLRIEAQGAQPPQTCVAVDCCIEKLDTSGELAGRMPLARALVAGYLKSLHRYSAALNVPAAKIHLFARAQPEYLFANSKDNPRKRILNDLELVKWWQSALQFALEYANQRIIEPVTDQNNAHSASPESAATCSRAAVVNCVVPGSAMAESTWFLGNDRTDRNGAAESIRSVEWRWGLPYPVNARAHDCVLQFPDDPIARLLSEEHSNEWSVSELLDMLSVSEECGSGHRAAFFAASLPLYPGTLTYPSANGNTASQGHLSLEDYDKILIALFAREMDFSNTESARLSSSRLVEYLDANFDIPHTSLETTGPTILRALPHEARPEDISPVNDLSTMVRKRRKVVS